MDFNVSARAEANSPVGATSERGAGGDDNDPLRLVLAALRESLVLHILPHPALKQLASAGTSLSVAKGGMLCQAGDVGDAVYVVLQGEIEILLRSADGRELRVAALGPGSLAGEMAALDGGPRSADMQATRACTLWRIPRSALLETLEAEPKMAIALLGELSRRLRSVNDALDASARLDLGARLARLLVKEGGSRGLVPLTQTEMARRLGASREKVNRKLHLWAAEHWVELTPAGVRVLPDLATPCSHELTSVSGRAGLLRKSKVLRPGRKK